MRNGSYGIALIMVVFFSKMSCGQEVYSDVIVDEYYFYAPLTQVFGDLETKYEIPMEYDSVVMSKYKLDYTFYKKPANEVFRYLCQRFPLLEYSYRDGTIVFVEAEEKEFRANSPFLGGAQAFNITINGIIKDELSGEPLPYAKVKVQGTQNGTYSNVDGYFTLFEVPTDTSIIEISYIGYQTQLYYLNPEIVLDIFEINLSSEVQDVDEVVVVSKGNQGLKMSEGISTIKLTPKQISDLPSLGEKDIFRSFQLMPGIGGSNEASAGLYVRGGTPDQNLIMYDGFTVYHQEHLFGMFSAFNSNAVKDVQLYKGGFESKFGGRLSSVMEITGKTGNENQFNIGGDISLLSANAYMEIPLNGKGSIFIAGRRSYRSPLYNKFFDAFSNDNNDNTPSVNLPGKGNRSTAASDPSSYFYDINAKMTYRPTNRDIISLSFFNSQDNLDNSREISRTRNGVAINGGVTDLTKWGNLGTSLKWSRKWNEKFYTNNLASFSNYYSIRELNKMRDVEINGEVTSFSQGSLEDNNLKDFSYKMENEWRVAKNHQLEFGLNYTHYDIQYGYIQNDTINILNMDDRGDLLSLYVQDKWSPFNRLSLLPSFRASYYNVTDEFYYEPRFQLSFDLTEKLKLKGAWGQYYQFANRIVREDILSGSRDFWVLSDGEEVPVSESMHYITGASYETKKWLFDVEAYYKDLKGLSEYTLRFAPSYGQGSIDYNSLFYQGVGYSQGLEGLVQRKFGKFTGWASYTLAQTRYNFPVYGDGYFSAAHDVTNEFKLTGIYKLNNWTFSGSWIYATGRAYTEPIGGYSLSLVDGSTTNFVVAGAKNSSRYPDYHRLDLSAKYNFDIGDSGSGFIGLSLFNVYNRKNIWYNEFEIDETGLTETNVNLLGITPNLTLSLKLR